MQISQDDELQKLVGFRALLGDFLGKPISLGQGQQMQHPMPKLGTQDTAKRWLLLN